MLKDKIGREVKVGDILAWSSTYSGISVNVVIKILPKTVRVDSGDLVYTNSSMIVNEQLTTTPAGENLRYELTEKNKDRFDYTPPKR